MKNQAKSKLAWSRIVQGMKRWVTSPSPVPSKVAFLYLDEKYLDTNAVDEMQVTSLGGLLVVADKYPVLRDRLFSLLPRFEDGPVAFDTEVHASDLFRDHPDEVHFAFYDGLVELVNELECRVYRRGCNFSPSHALLREHEKTYIHFCFKSILLALNSSDLNAQIWPVIEIDHTQIQDTSFAGYVRWMGHSTAYLNFIGEGVEELIEIDQMIDARKFGDLHYVSKKSIVGSASDCLVYLLHCRWLLEQGCTLGGYKKALASIAMKLDHSLVDDHVVQYRRFGAE